MYLNAYHSVSQVSDDIKRYIKWYNSWREHSIHGGRKSKQV
ncbi:MAG: hypothetical protein EBX40_01520 [Gammaproteobacteria bacterium]|nr:hypothetical protein [Gammaproteobacteria bacterium]